MVNGTKVSVFKIMSPSSLCMMLTIPDDTGIETLTDTETFTAPPRLLRFHREVGIRGKKADP